EVEVLGATFRGFLGIDFKDLFHEFLVSRLDLGDCFRGCHAHVAAFSIGVDAARRREPAGRRVNEVYATAWMPSSAALLPISDSSTAFMMPCSISRSSSSSMVIGVGIVPLPTLACIFCARLR